MENTQSTVRLSPEVAQKTADFDQIQKKLAVFGDEQVNARLSQLVKALTTLTLVEFRTWKSACETFDSFDVSHFQGLEKAFIQTGKWELPTFKG